MATKTIGQLTQATTINNTDQFAIEQSGVTKRVAASVVRGDIINANIKSDAAIAFSKLAALNSAQILVGNGSNVPTAVSVTGDVTISNAGVTALAAGAVVTADVADAAITAPKLASKIPVQTVVATSSSFGQTAALIPADDTVPLSTEGTEFMTGSITPTSSSNSVVVDFSAQVTATGAAVVVAIFRSTTCIAAQIVTPASASYASAVSMRVSDSPATTSAVTYSVRFGNSQGTTYTSYINGAGSGRVLGGAQKATLTMAEINA